jgi:preprotein translocase subunit SecA
MPAELLAQAEKWVLLETIDHAWRLHLQNIDHLREGIGLRGYGQKNPLIEYKKNLLARLNK